MANLDEHIDLIERFFEGNLNEDEQKLLQKKLETDPDFSKSFQTEKDIVEGIQAAGDIALRKRLEKIHNDTIESTSKPAIAKRVIFTKRVRMLAAVIILAIVAGVAIYQINIAPFEERTFMAYYNSPSFEDLTRGETVGADALLKTAKEKFDVKDYQDALTDLNIFLSENPKNEDALLMKGISQLETEDFAGAAESFKSVPANSDRYDIAVWHLGLSYLRQNKIEEAKSEFMKLAEGTVPAGPKRITKAKELLDLLN